MRTQRKKFNRPITVLFPEGEAARVKQTADDLNQSVSEMVRQTILGVVKAHEGRR